LKKEALQSSIAAIAHFQPGLVPSKPTSPASLKKQGLKDNWQTLSDQGKNTRFKLKPQPKVIQRSASIPSVTANIGSKMNGCSCQKQQKSDRTERPRSCV